MTRLAGRIALVVGAALTLVGTFLPLYTEVFAFERDNPLEVGHTSWGLIGDDPSLRGGPRYGVPMVVGVCLVLSGARYTARMWGRLTAISGAMLLTGSVWLVAQQVLSLFTTAHTRVMITTELGPGTFVLAAASLIALAGALLVQDWPPRAPKPDVVVYRVDDGESGDDGTDTPPFGIPVDVEITRPPETGHERPSGGAS